MKKTDWLISAALGLVAAVLYFVGCADFAYPGRSAHLLCLVNSLDAEAWTRYPLTGLFARIFGGGNLLSPVCGAISVALAYGLSAVFFRSRMGGENVREWSGRASVLAGVGVAVLFMLMPQTRLAATHLEPAMFHVAWMLGALALALRGGWAAVCVSALMWGAALAETAVMLAMLPVFLAAVWLAANSKRRGASVAAAIVLAIAAFFAVLLFGGNVGEGFKALSEEFSGWFSPSGWILVLSFTTIPFAVTFFSSRVAFNEEPTWAHWVFHSAMSVASVLAIASPLGAATLLADVAVPPVASGLFAAWTAGYLLAYWYVLTRARVRINESRDDKPVALKGRSIGLVAGSVLGAIYAIAAVFNLFMFDSSRGSFADKVARAVISDMGDREWIVSDGTLDDHLRLVAAAEGRNIKVVSLNRDLDEDYLAALAEMVRGEKLGGERCEELALSLSLGVLPFVQDWFASDEGVADKVVVFGAPDLWYAAGRKPIPERWFFGSGKERGNWCGNGGETAAREEMLAILEAPKGWGSFNMRKTRNPIDRMRLELRRHLGLVANDRGVYLQDEGRTDDAYAAYDETLSKIDSDNVCALFNLFEMATMGAGDKAKGRIHELEKRLKAIVDDSSRRYRLWALANYYGYIRSPEIFIRAGYMWARSGRPGEALAHINRAVDFIPTDRRSAILNMMASLYASEDNRAKSRAIYEEVLETNASDHDALIGLMRLALMDGDQESALKYLEQATQGRGEDKSIRMEIAMVHMMKHELDAAYSILREAADESGEDLRPWSLLAAVMMQQSDDAKDPVERKRIDTELEEKVLPEMEERAKGANDFYVQNTKAFILMRKGAESRKAARDAFVAAAKARPDVTSTQDMVLGLDISLDDPVSAESHAREVLRRDRRHPLANYVMGSLALRKEDYQGAEIYLRKAADHERPVVLAMNDLAEVYRRRQQFVQAEKYARMAIKTAPKLYVVHETLGSVLMDAGGDLAEAEESVQKAVDLSRVDGRAEDIRMLVSLARVQILRGDKQKGLNTLKRVEKRKSELSAFELKAYEDLRNDAAR